jgi:Sigma-70, region 4
VWATGLLPAAVGRDRPVGHRLRSHRVWRYVGGFDDLATSAELLRDELVRLNDVMVPATRITAEEFFSIALDDMGAARGIREPLDAWRLNRGPGSRSAPTFTPSRAPRREGTLFREGHIGPRREVRLGHPRQALAPHSDDGYAATSNAIARRVAIRERVVDAVARADVPVVSLDGATGLIVKESCADEANPSAYERVHSGQRRRAVWRALATLGPPERAVLELSFGIGCRPMPPLMIAHKLGIRRQRVSQIYYAEIRRLRRPPILVLLKDYA